MAIRLQGDPRDEVFDAKLMRDDGRLAVIVEWGAIVTRIGLVVKRHEDWLLRIGESSGRSWDTFFSSGGQSDCKVRYLRDGELLVYRDNQGEHGDN